MITVGIVLVKDGTNNAMIAGAFQIFDIDDTSGSSTKTVKPRDSDKEAQTIALQFVRRYCDLSATTDLSPYR